MPVQDYAEEAINSNRNLALEVMFAVALRIQTKVAAPWKGMIAMFRSICRPASLPVLSFFPGLRGLGRLAP
jgi:hypothetical protein